MLSTRSRYSPRVRRSSSTVTDDPPIYNDYNDHLISKDKMPGMPVNWTPAERRPPARPPGPRRSRPAPL